jgi:hypothetical protein
VTSVVVCESFSVFMEQISDFCTWVSSTFCCVLAIFCSEISGFFLGSCLSVMTFLFSSQPSFGHVFL